MKNTGKSVILSRREQLSNVHVSARHYLHLLQGKYTKDKLHNSPSSGHPPHTILERHYHHHQYESSYELAPPLLAVFDCGITWCALLGVLTRLLVVS